MVTDTKDVSMIITIEEKIGLYSVELTGDAIKEIAKAAKQTKRSRERIVQGCILYGLAFILYLLEQ